MQCLIVAAGKGLRLRAHGNSKPLVELAGKPLIHYVIERAAQGGVTDFVIVTGYEAETLETSLKQFAHGKPFSFTFVRNPDFERPNGLSVVAAKEALRTPFLLSMCDHLMDPEMVRQMAALNLGAAGAILGIDRNLKNPLVDIDDVTRVKTDDDKIVAIGKGLPEFDAFDTGIFLAGHGLLDAIEASGREGDWSISGGMLELAKEGRALVHDLTGRFWIDVDSPEMFNLAEKYLSQE